MKSPKIYVSTSDFSNELSLYSEEELAEDFVQNDKNIEIIIDQGNKLHQFLGIGYSFEHTSCANILKLSEKDQTKVLKLLVDPIKGAGMELWRLCIGTPDFTPTPWYSYLDQELSSELNEKELFEYLDKNFSIEKDKELIIPIVKKAQEINPNLIFFASPWSPPAWFKDTNNMCSGKLLKKFWNVYAEYLVKFVLEYEKLGVPIHAITIQNEPLHNVKSMPSCKWDIKGTEERDFLKESLGPAFRRANLKTKIWIYDHNFDFLGWLNLLRKPARYPQTILNDIEAKQYVDGVGFHHYAAVGFSSPKMMQKLHKIYPDMPFYFTEGSLNWAWGALRFAKYLQYGAKSISGWVPVYCDDDKLNNGPFKKVITMIHRILPDNSIKLNFTYYMNAHYSKFVKKDAYILETQMKNKPLGFYSISFLNPNNEIITVMTNRSNKKRDCFIQYGDELLNLSIKPKSMTTICLKK